MPGTMMRPVIYGEVLFDEFEDGSRIAGGAPFNVAWHLNGFGLNPLFVSRIGKDDKGEEIRSLMKTWDMDMTGLQSDINHSTGSVCVKLQDGQPEFDITHPVAYDYIEWTPLSGVLSNNVEPIFLYHGSLAVRSPVSAQTLDALRQQASCIFVDINLRTPWWQQNIVDSLLHQASWIKLNSDELDIIIESRNNTGTDEDKAELFLQKYKPAGLIITRGDRGAVLYTDNEIHTAEPVVVNNLLDTVGAGDAFSAVCICGMLNSWNIRTTLQRATGFASAICQQRGATTTDKSLYASFLQQWGMIG